MHNATLTCTQCFQIPTEADEMKEPCVYLIDQLFYLRYKHQKTLYARHVASAKIAETQWVQPFQEDV
jgi:hypothetical protein